MQTDRLKSILMISWVAAVGLFGYLWGATSFTAWIALGVVSLTLPVIVMTLWRVPAESMSESIDAARR